MDKLDERKKFLFVIIFGVVGLFFLFTRFCLPITKDNARLAAEYKQLKTEVKAAGELSGSKLNSSEARLDNAISDLQKKFTVEGKSKVVEQLTQVPAGISIVFAEITQRQPIEAEGYQALPVGVNIKAQFTDFIKYLAELEKGSLFIGSNNLDLRRVEAEEGPLEIRATFLGFRLTQQFPSISKYMEGRYVPLDKEFLETLLAPLKLAQAEAALPNLRDYSPFVYGAQKGPVVERGEALKMENLSLKGILRIGNQKAALINDTLVKTGDKVAGVEVLEIENDRVAVLYAGKRYILKTGVDDAFLKP